MRNGTGILGNHSTGIYQVPSGARHRARCSEEKGKIGYRNISWGASLAVKRLGLQASSAGGGGSILGLRAKIPHAWKQLAKK